jgi:hypothetical protein
VTTSFGHGNEPSDSIKFLIVSSVVELLLANKKEPRCMETEC